MLQIILDKLAFAIIINPYFCSMMKTIRKITALAAIALICLLPQAVSAQGDPDPGCPPFCPGDPSCPPECVPIDGGLTLLIAAGLGLGAKKAYDRRKAAVKIAE